MLMKETLRDLRGNSEEGGCVRRRPWETRQLMVKDFYFVPSSMKWFFSVQARIPSEWRHTCRYVGFVV